MGGRMRAWMVYPIFLVVWVIILSIFHFSSWKKLNAEYKKTVSARDASRGKYGSSTTSKALWPAPPKRPEAKYKKGAEDKKQDEDAAKSKMDSLEKDLQKANVERDAHKADLEKILKRYMVGIDRKRFDYQKPDEFVLELLKQQRDDAGPRLIRFLDANYKNLFFRFPIPVPPPNINLTGATLPAPSAQGSLAWPVGSGPLAMTVYGRYEDLLDFVSTFPDRFDRTALISSFSLQRLAFDYRGSVLLQLNCSVEFYVWPTNAPGSPGAGGAAAIAGAVGAMGGAPGAPPMGPGPGAPPPGGGAAGSGAAGAPPPGGAGGSGAGSPPPQRP